MTDPEGGFYSTQDADGEGQEGKFFVWKPAEIQSVLGKEAEAFMKAYGVTCTVATSTLFVVTQELVSCYACLSEYRPQG
jgi:uncharacterized protein YyaL (SSP411 family)